LYLFFLTTFGVYCRVCSATHPNESKYINPTGVFQTVPQTKYDLSVFKRHLTGSSHENCHDYYLQTHVNGFYDPNLERIFSNEAFFVAIPGLPSPTQPNFFLNTLSPQEVDRGPVTRARLNYDVFSFMCADMKRMMLKIQFMLVFFMVKQNIPDVKYTELLGLIHILLLRFFPYIPPFSHTKHPSFLVFLSLLADVARGIVKDAYMTSHYYALIMDEYTDISRISNVAFYIRLFDSCWNLRTFFLCSRQVSKYGCTSYALFVMLTQVLHAYSISRKGMLFFTADGASVMMGHVMVLAARLVRRFLL
jgi:hypothetical protein